MSSQHGLGGRSTSTSILTRKDIPNRGTLRNSNSSPSIKVAFRHSLTCQMNESSHYYSCILKSACYLFRTIPDSTFCCLETFQTEHIASHSTTTRMFVILLK